MRQHSALIVISIEEKYIVYFDPCIHEMDKCSKRYINKCLEFLKNDRKLRKIHWKIYKLENGPEKFSREIECDVAVMAFAECLLLSTNLISQHVAKDFSSRKWRGS
ncbi:Hypothetical predicted protein [Octopus vulgaris]|uniref:Uncharacterized protein n=1 Tax=Octopus vulgaris TaxID=6645 RepID=A0AA36ARD6_OCTVU|nr:Hypothetical predicted protein [Octopus vulgaris]